jgi:hypothetical protein
LRKGSPGLATLAFWATSVPELQAERSVVSIKKKVISVLVGLIDFMKIPPNSWSKLKRQ